MCEVAAIKLTDSINSLVAMMTCTVVAGFVGVWAGYSVGVNRGFDAGLKYVDEMRKVQLRDAFEAMNAGKPVNTETED